MSCPAHGVKQIAVPWAEAGSQFTAWFERLAIDVLYECSVKGAAELLRLTWDEAWGIKERAVARGEPSVQLLRDRCILEKPLQSGLVIGNDVAQHGRGEAREAGDEDRQDRPEGEKFVPVLPQNAAANDAIERDEHVVETIAERCLLQVEDLVRDDVHALVKLEGFVGGEEDEAGGDGNGEKHCNRATTASPDSSSHSETL